MKKPLTERQIEKAVRDAAIKLGYLTYKFTSPSNCGVPDRIFINPHGYVFFIEFKSNIGKLTALQSKVFKEIVNHNLPVYVFRDVDKCIDQLKYLLSVKIHLGR